MNTFNQGAQMRAQQQFGTPGEFGSLQNSVRTVPDPTMVDPTMVDPAMVNQQQALNPVVDANMANMANKFAVDQATIASAALGFDPNQR